MGLQDGDGKTQTWFSRLYKLVCFKLTLEYCLRRLNRCTISTDGRTHSWSPCSTPLQFVLPEYTLIHIVNCTFTCTHIHTHTEGTQATILSIHPCAHTLSSTTQTQVGREREGEGEGGEKKGGRASKDKDSSAVLPSTHIHSDPPSSSSLSLTHKVTHSRCSHHMAVNEQMISSTHSSLTVTHTHTPLHILF